MSQDIKEVEKESEKTDSQDASLDTTNEGVKTDADNDSQAPVDEVKEIDYKAELEKVQATLVKAEHKIVELKTKKEDKDDFSFVNQDDVSDSNDDDIDSKIASKVAESVATIRSEMVKELMSDVIKDELSNLSSNEDEKNLILLHYENSIKQSGVSRDSIKSDLNKAYLIANQSKFLKENKEIKEAMKAKNSIQNSSVGNNQSHEKNVKVPTLSEADLAFCRKHGIDPKTVDFNQVKR